MKPDLADTAAAWGNRISSATVVKVFGLFALFCMLGLLVSASYPRTVPDTLAREVVVALIGALATILTAIAVALAALNRELRDSRESIHLLNFAKATWERSALRIGRMEIPDIVVVASAARDREWTNGVNMRFNDFVAERSDPAEMDPLVSLRLPRLREGALKNATPFTDDPCVDLVGASVRMVVNERTGRRERFFELTPAPTSYFKFALTSADLDSPIDLGTGESSSLRDRWGVRATDITDVRRLPAPAKIGVGTAVVTSDSQLVLGIRGRTFIAGKQDRKDDRSLVHIVAEGMLLGDLNRQGRLDPRETARRAISEELAISGLPGALGQITELKATGFFFDQQRWQPCFAFLAHTDLTWPELQTVAPSAQDHWEVERLISVPFTVEHPDVRYLLTESHPNLAFASNHAAAVVWFALLHQHGFADMRAALTVQQAVHFGTSDRKVTTSV